MTVLDIRRGAHPRTMPLRGGTGAPTVDPRAGAFIITDNGPVRAVTTKTASGSTTAYLPIGRGRLYVLDAHTGVPRRTIPLGGDPLAVVVHARHGHLLVLEAGRFDTLGALLGPGSLAVLDERSGRLLRTIQVGEGAFDMVPDAHTGHLFVESGAPGPAPLDPRRWMPGWLRRRLPLLGASPAPRSTTGAITTVDTGRL